jgi:hypothetical protein
MCCTPNKRTNHKQLKYNSWRRANKNLICLGRPGYTAAVLKAMAADGFEAPDPKTFLNALHTVASTPHHSEQPSVKQRLFLLVEDASVELSSTTIRQRMQSGAAGLAWLLTSGWMHPAVVEYLSDVGPKLYLPSKLKK